MNKQFLQLFDRNIKGKFSYLPSRNPHMAIKSIGNIALIDSGLNSNMFNILYCNGTIERESIKIALDYLRKKRLPFAFWIGFEDDPSWLEEELLAFGLVTDETEWAMLCDLHKQTLNPSSFDIRQILDTAGIQDVIQVLNAILPHEEHSAIRSFYESSTPALLEKGSSLTLFVGYENGNPISLSASYCDQGIASIFDVIVLPEMRGKGLGKTMTLRAMQDAQEKGIHKCVLTATNDAKYLYQKIGFKDLKTMKVYHDP